MRVSTKTLIFALAGILVVSLLGMWYVARTHEDAVCVVVTVDGETFGTYPIDKDAIILIAPEDNSWHNTLLIENGSASIIDSDCDNQICVNTPAVTADIVGLIVCLPHGVVVELRQ